MNSKQHLKLVALANDPTNAEIADFLVKGMGMPYTIVIKSDMGRRYPNGSATGIVGMLDRGEADVSAFPLPIGYIDFNKLRYDFPVHATKLTFASLKYQVEREPFSIFDPFSFQVWLSVILLSILMTLVLCALLQKGCKFGDILKNIISTILGKSVTFKHRNEKLLMCSWLLGVMFLINCYLSLLFSALAIPREQVIRSIAQLSKEVEDGRCRVFSKLATQMLIFSRSEDKSLSIIGKNTEIIHNGLFHRDFIQKTKGSRLVTIDLRPAFDISDEDDDFYISDDYFQFLYLSFPVSYKFCCMEKLNRVVHRITQAGLFMKDDRARSWKDKYLQFSSQNYTEDAIKPLTLKNLLGALVILFCGHFAALLCLVVEMLMPRLSRMTNRSLPKESTIVEGQTGQTISFEDQSAENTAGNNLVSLPMSLTSHQFDPGNAYDTV